MKLLPMLGFLHALQLLSAEPLPVQAYPPAYLLVPDAQAASLFKGERLYWYPGAAKAQATLSQLQGDEQRAALAKAFYAGSFPALCRLLRGELAASGVTRVVLPEKHAATACPCLTPLKSVAGYRAFLLDVCS